MADGLELKRIVDLVAQTDVDDGVYTIIDSVSGAVKKYPVGSFICSIAPIFSTSVSYTAGKYCNYNGQLYQFDEDHAAGGWIGTDATAVTLSDILSENGEDITDLQSDVSALQTDVETLEDQINALFVTDTASGPIASFPDGADDIPVKDMTVQIEPVQDLHGYDYPWPAGGGVNKLDASKYYGHPDDAVTAMGVVFSKEGDDTFVVTITNYSGAYEQPALVGFDTTMPFFDKTGLTLTRFVTSDSNSIIRNVRWATAASNNNIAVDLQNLTSGTSAVAKFKLVAYSGSTAPTSWSPYSNECPITGWTGANVYDTGFNVWDEEWESGDIYAENGQDASNQNIWRTKNYIPVLPSTSYYAYSPTASNKSIRARFYDANKNYIGHAPKSGSTFTDSAFVTPDGAHFMRFAPNNSDIPNHDVSINYPSTDHDYHAYSGTTYPISWTSQGTVYGGYVDKARGKLVAEYVSLKANTLTSRACELLDGRLMALIWCYAVSGLSYIPNIQNNEMVKCSFLPVISGVDGWGRNTLGISSYNNEAWLIITIPPTFLSSCDNTGADAWLSALPDNYTVTWKLNEPVEYDLSDLPEITTLLGQNNIWADTGDTSVEYRADTKLYIAKKIAESA